MITIAAILGVAAAIGKALAVAGLAIEGLKAVCGALVSLGKALGLIPQEQKIEDLGEKALQAEEKGIKPENYDSYEQYHKAISEFEIDPEKAKLHSDADRLSKGAEVVGSLIAEKYPDAKISDVVAYMAKNPNGFFCEKNMGAIGELIKTGGQAIGNILGVLKGTERNQDNIENAYSSMADVLKTAAPKLSAEEARKMALKF